MKLSAAFYFCVGILAATASAQSIKLRDQIAQHEQKLAEARAASSLRNVAVELNNLASLYRQAGETQKALDDCNQALQIEESAGSRLGQALTQGIIGRIDSDLGQEQKALDLFNQTLLVWRELGSPIGEATTLNNLGRVYNNLGQRQKALDVLNQALPIWRKLGNRSGEASTLDNLGKTYSDMAQEREALTYFNQALPLWREAKEQGGEGLTLTNLGKVYADLGQMKQSLDYYHQALAIWREIGNRPGEAGALNWMGRVYGDLGQKQTALDDYNLALPIWREVGNRNGEALALNDIGKVFEDLNQGQKALEFYNLALPIWRQVGNRRGEATTLNNIGRDYILLGDINKALEIDYQSLAIWREVQDSRGQAMALSAIASAYFALGLPQKALAIKLAALSLAKEAGDPDLQGGIETSLMLGFRDQHHPEEAIFYGMDAVNSYQQIRKNISGLNKDLQAGFAQSKSATYRTLAELLVEACRLGEAEQILDLLKEEELKDIVLGASPDAAAKVEPLKLTGAQQKAQSDMEALEKKALAFEEFNVAAAVLRAKASRTPEEEAQLKTLDAKIEKENTGILDYFTYTIYPELERKPVGGENQDNSARNNSTQSYLQNTLAKLGPSVMGIRLLLGKDHAYAIVVTASTRRKFELKATPAELRSKAFEALQALGARGSDPRPQLVQLFAMIAAPLEDELKAMEAQADALGRVPTLLWSLDDALRYLPMAALYDGRHYLVERFNNVLFAPESYGHMTDSSPINGGAPSVLAMGLSRSYGGLPALPGVMPELDAVVHDPAAPDSHGPMEGKLLPNEQFTLAALKSELGAGKSYPIVHIASHFVVETGSGAEPYLMLGGEDSGEAKGYAWNLSEMENSTVAFHGTRLLTLSACSTAK
ncbi:MAG: CHAT domain-containing tetratricopeptide repeat protein, partial [Terracidiphilus sp.]